MDITRKKISTIADELTNFLFHVGATKIKIELEHQEGGYQIALTSDYLPEERKKVEDLDRFLRPANRNEGLEEFFWQLAGISGCGQDSQLDLIGQMLDCATVEITDTQVSLLLFKAEA